MKFRLFAKKQSLLPWWCDVVVLGLAAIVFLGLLLPALGVDSAYFDEGYSAYLAKYSPLHIAHYTALDVHPPLYYVVLHYWAAVFGDSIFTLRSLSVVFGLIAIVFAFLSVRTSFGQKAAYGILPFVVLSPLFLRYTEAMRMYSMVIAICMAATYVLIKLLQQRQSSRQSKLLWAAYAGLVAAGMWTNYFTALVWVSHMTWLLYENRKRGNGSTDVTRHFLRHWIVAISAAIVLYLPWIPALIMRFTDVQNSGFWIKPLSIDTLVSTITMGLTFTTSARTDKWLAIGVLLFVVTAIVVARLAYKQIDGSRRQSYRLFMATAMLPIAFLILLSLPPLQSSFVYRYALVAVFSALIVVGISFSIVRFKHNNAVKKAVLFAGSAAILIIGVTNVRAAGNRSLDTDKKAMVSQVIMRINDDAEKGVPIVIRSPYTYYSAALYESDTHPIYFVHDAKYLKAIGSTRMLYDDRFNKGINDLGGFTADNTRVWMVAEDPLSIRKPTNADWTKIQSFIVTDKGKPAGYAAEYTLR